VYYLSLKPGSNLIPVTQFKRPKHTRRDGNSMQAECVKMGCSENMRKARSSSRCWKETGTGNILSTI
jgi:hypothetical protein